MANDSRDSKDRFIPISQMLHHKPQLGPIPGEMVIPWGTIIIVSYLLCQAFMGLGWTATCLVAVWGMGSCWLLFGNQGFRYLHKFERVPRWTRGQSLYQSLLHSSNDNHDLPEKPSRKRSSSKRTRSKKGVRR